MSAKDQLNDSHQGRHHKWKARMKDWFLLPCSHVAKQPRGITPSELSRHNGKIIPNSYWIAVEGNVYDVTQFMKYHPGGSMIFEEVVGRECTREFEHNHLSFKIHEATPELLVGPLVNERIENDDGDDDDDGARKNVRKNSTGGGGNDDDDEADHLAETFHQEELNDEDQEALKDLFDSLLSEENNSETGMRLKNSADVISEAQFNNFLVSSGVTEEERDVTVKRLKELRPNAREDGVDFKTFVSLF